MSGRGGARAGAARPPLSAALLHAWRESLPSEQWQSLDAAAIARAAAEQLQFGARRRPGQTLLRILAPPTIPVPPDAGGAVIELISEDMPFLVDTLLMGIAQAGLSVQLIIHPILQVRRDAAGRLRALRAAGTGSGAGSADGTDGVRESWQHLRIDPIGAVAGRRELLRRLRSALADLRHACRDWPRMRHAVLELCADIARNPPALAGDVVAESRALLQYMEAHHFTFLGLRANRLRRTGRGPRLLSVAHTSLGLLRQPSARQHDGGAVSADNIRRALRSHRAAGHHQGQCTFDRAPPRLPGLHRRQALRSRGPRGRRGAHPRLVDLEHLQRRSRARFRGCGSSCDTSSSTFHSHRTVTTASAWCRSWRVCRVTSCCRPPSPT